MISRLLAATYYYLGFVYYYDKAYLRFAADTV
jgi:hypothetical protein